MTLIYAIHGAFSSPVIFNYLQRELGPKYAWHFLDYQNETGGLRDLIANVPSFTEPHHVIGHSMGGLMALALIQLPWVVSVTTISTPLGGVDINIMQQYLSRSEFMTDISSSGDFIRGLKKSQPVKPVQHLISTRGFNPWIYEPCDGVVTVRSQRAFSLGKTHDIPSNHTEIMLNDSTVAILKKFWV